MRLRVAVASPEMIRRRSSGVVVSPEDLFDPALFGPARDAAHFGHLELAYPCLHPALSDLAADLLGLTHRALRRRLAARGGLGLREELAAVEPGAALARLRSGSAHLRPLAEAYLASGSSLASLVLSVLPVPPPALRLPGTQLDACYRRVMASRGSPTALQSAVDELFLRGWRSRDVRTDAAWAPALPTPTTWVDYPVVPDLSLRLDQCALPESLAREQAAPLLARGLTLDEALRDRALLLVAPGAGGLASRPIVGADGALRLHPLALAALGGRFGESRLGVHLLLGERASREALALLRPQRQLLAPTNALVRLASSDELAVACWRLTWLHPREAAHQELRAFSSPEEVLVALALGEVYPGERLALRWQGRRLATTAGRVAFNAALPRALQFVDAEINLHRLRELVGTCHERLGERAAVQMLESLTRLAAEWATRLAFTLGKDDFTAPAARDAALAECDASLAALQAEYDEGLITDGERYNRVIDFWSHAAERASTAVIRDREERLHAGRADLLVSALHAGIGGGTAQLRTLSGLIGLTAKRSEELVEVPVRHSLGEGLDPGEFFRTASRAKQLRARQRAHQAARLHRHLRRSLGGIRVSVADCGARDGILVEEDFAGAMRSRLLGRVLAAPVRDAAGEVVAQEGIEVSPRLADLLAVALDGRPARVRSPLACAASEGVCAACYGRNPATGRRASPGERVGLLAALAIASELPGLRMRTFHIGGCTTRFGWGTALARHEGTARLDGGWLTRKDGEVVAASAMAAVVIVAPGGAELERHEVPRGAICQVRSGAGVGLGARLAEWDPNARVTLSQATGRAVLCDLEPERTLFEALDEVTGLSRRVVRHAEGSALRPRVEVRDASGATLEVQHLADGALLLVQDGDAVGAGDALARRPVRASSLQAMDAGQGDDATAVERLLCAWRPLHPFLLATEAGTVEWLAPEHGPRLLRLVGPEGVRAEHRIARGRHVNVAVGEVVRKGELLLDGDYDPHQVLATLGVEALAGQLLEGLLECFGTALAPVHLEVALRHLLRQARGASPRLVGLDDRGPRRERFRLALGPVGVEIDR